MEDSKSALLDVRGLTKAFGRNIVLNKVDFKLLEGEVHVLFGENGAGKSTFTKILCGGYIPNDGEVFIKGDKFSVIKPAIARKLGIVAVHQDFSLVPQLSVVENLYLGAEKKGKLLLNKKLMYNEAKNFFNELNIGFKIDLDEKIERLSMEKQQVVAIARALLQPIRILILDEPTSNFTDKETEILFAQIRRLKENGIGIIYISHIVEELKEIGDKVTILRDGSVVGHINKNNDITKENLLKGMVQRRQKKETYTLDHNIGELTLELRNISTESGLKNIDLHLFKGEILGIGGLPGSGKALIGRVIFGLEKITEGKILLKKNIVKSKMIPSNAIENGIAYFPAEKLEGLVLCRDIKENISLPSLKDKFTKFGFLNKNKEINEVSKMISKLNVKPNEMKKHVRFLSGGNQQKVIIGRGLVKEAKIFLFDEVTRGVDISSKIDFYQIILEIAKTSNGIIFITSEITELLDLCNRVIIMYNSKIFAHFTHEEATREKLVHSILGLTMEQQNER